MEFVGINLLDSGSIFLPITEENETPGRDREKNFWRMAGNQQVLMCIKSSIMSQGLPRRAPPRC